MTDRGPRRRPHVSVRALGDECLLYDAARARIHVLNGVAASVWEMCDGHHPLETMAGRVRAGYDVPPDADVVEDIGSVIAAFAGLDLLDLRPGDPAP